jgi:anti-sigma regulatory factor (Ser/Thr protein kinase)
VVVKRTEEAVDQAERRALAGGGWRLSARLPRDRTCPTVARRLLEEHAGEELGEQTRQDALLIASELATNAFVHGTGAIVLNVWRLDNRLRIEVRDEGAPGWIGLVPEGQRKQGGHGLSIVKQVASDWGVLDRVGHVWAELVLADVVSGGR